MVIKHSTEKYQNVTGASKRLTVHPETIKRLCRNGELPAAKFGNAWLILCEDLDEFARTYVPRRGARSKINS